MKYSTVIDGETFIIEINSDDGVIIDGQLYDIDFVRIGDSNLYSLLINNESFEALVEEHDGVWQVQMRGDLYAVSVADERAQRMAQRAGSMTPQTGDVIIKAPMPGLVVAIVVEVGQEVAEGDTIVILESMKMENELKTPRDGVVDRIDVEVSQSIEQQQILVIIT